MIKKWTSLDPFLSMIFFNTCGKQKQDKIIIYGNGQRL